MVFQLLFTVSCKIEVIANCRPRHSAWKNSCDSLAVVGLHENWTLALRCQVSGVSTASGLKSLPASGGRPV